MCNLVWSKHSNELVSFQSFQLFPFFLFLLLFFLFYFFYWDIFVVLFQKYVICCDFPLLAKILISCMCIKVSPTFIPRQHSWLFTEPDTCVEISLPYSSSKVNRTFLSGFVLGKWNHQGFSRFTETPFLLKWILRLTICLQRFS